MATKTDKRRKRLQAFAKRRAQRPSPTFVPTSSMKIGGGVERKLVRDHADLLRQIESVLVEAASNSGDVDDRCIEKTLRHAVTDKPSESALINSVLKSLSAVRLQQSDDSSDRWSDALRVVYASLKRHSDCEQGEFSYLNFAAQYVG